MTASDPEMQSIDRPATDNRPIAVGVNDSAGALLAVEWAAREAVRLGCSLRLVHAYPVNVLHEPLTAPIGHERAEILFGAARERIHIPANDGLPVSSTAQQGSAKRVLLHVADGARMLVVGRERVGRLAELVLGSTALACAGHTPVPVTVVPRMWMPAALDGGAIILGVDGSVRCRPAIEYAFATAARCELPLTAVTVVGERIGPRLGWASGDNPLRSRADGHRVLEEALAGFRETFPSVEVRTVVDDRTPVDALSAQLARTADAGGDESTIAGTGTAGRAAAAALAGRVVIGGRGHGLVTGAMLGSVARSLLRGLPCPVTVVHAGEGRRTE
ncbi:universal stress protein [Phytoactinopolyspora halotolerans]|uniref:Universal stress protein n=1 Tax=Phytoactinopolyspora halotolerans TaxID=1981512 RepID=A0A6L9S7D0_9ACTN|nr:universal stress protein [Phytoactinopolyspora halotolerans]NEE00651.1 universal stress protein [Phytoactinopolyspora halotolerans]